MDCRRDIIQGLSENPDYWLLSVRERLILVKQVETRQEIDARAFRIAALAWVKGELNGHMLCFGER